MFTTSKSVVSPFKQVLIGAFITIGLSVSSSAAGETDNGPDSKTIESLDELARAADHQRLAERTAANFLDGIIEGFEDAESDNHIEKDYVNLAKQIAERIYTSDRILASIHTNLQRELDPSDYVPLIALYRSDLRQRELTAEESARKRLESPDGSDVLEAYIKTYRASSQFVVRSKLINDLHDSLAVSELMAQMLIDAQIATVIGLSYAQPLENNADLDAVLASIRAQQPTIEQFLREQFAHYQAYVYRGFNTEDINTLTTLYSSDQYQRYFGAVMQGLRVGLTQMSIEFGDKLGYAMALAESAQEL